MSLKQLRKKILSRSNERYYEVTRNINCIPKGIYKIRSQAPGAFEFEIGSKVSFVIINSSDHDIKKMPRELGEKLCTDLDEFLDHYYELLRKREVSMPSFDPFKPITMCKVHPSVAREVH